MANQKNLVIVESPAKAKTIGKFLGDDYKVLSSYGHIRDLKPSSFSVDVEHHFAPIYEIPADKQRVVDVYKRQTYDMVMRFAPIPATTRGKGTAAGDAGQISARDRKGHRDRYASI